MAVSGFKGFGWILCIATVAPACYMVSSRVAAERGRVGAVEYAIIQAQRDIRGLETEFDTRANMAQLERWNGDVLALSAPRPDQYLASASGLAAMRPLEGGVQRYAALVVPSGVPIQTAALDAAVLPSPAAVETAQASVKAAVTSTVTEGRAQAVAMIDGKLLSDRALGDIVSSARAEKVAMR